MNYEVIEALGQIIREKNVDRDVVWDTVKNGLIAAVKNVLVPAMTTSKLELTKT